MVELSAAMRASLGKLTLHAVTPARLLDPDERQLTTFEVPPAGAVIGRDEDADVTLRESGGYVSRRHLLLLASGVRWMAVDLGSSHGTQLMSARGNSRDLVPEVPVPLATGSQLILARVASVVITIEAAGPKGHATREPKGARDDREFLQPPLDQFAFELLRPRRESPGSAAIPSVPDLAEKLHVSGRVVYTYRKQLAAMRPVARRLDPEKLSWVELADAVAAVYPYLAAPILGATTD